jgi:hypothetical protein
MKRLTAFTLVILAGASAQALAAATAEEAARLTSVFQSYFGAEPGVVTVTPEGDNYSAKLDFMPIFARIKDPNASASMSPIVMTLSDQGGGKWKVTQDQQLDFQFKAEGVIDMRAGAGSLKSEGVFNEALGAFESSSTDVGQFGLQQKVRQGGATTSVDYTIAAVHYETTMTGTGDAANGTVKMTFKDLRETVGMPAAPDGSMPPMELSITSPSGAQDTTITGLKPRAVSELIAWFVSKPSVEAIKTDQAQLKDKLRAALPLFGNVSGTTTLDDLSVNTMMGVFGMQKLDVLVDMNGVVENGALREKFSITGLKVPDMIVPPWASSLVPDNLTIDFKLADFNLAAPAKLVIDNFDLTQKPPLKPEIESQLLQALLPKGAVSVGLGASEIIAKIFDLKLEGSMTAGPMAMPAGQALVKLKGIDEVMAALQAAPPEMGMAQMAPMFIVAKGMAKAEPDGYLSWKVESTPTGSVLVNGVDPMKMGGQ